MPSAPSPRILGHSDFGDADVSQAPGKFFYYFIHFLNYTNVLQVSRQQRTATTTTVMLATHQSHFDASN